MINMPEQNLCVEWADFDTFTKRTVCNLLGDTEFTDVTLVSDDNRQIQAHKAILSACSPFFKIILKNNPHQHPLLFLRGVLFEDLQALVHFIYQGKTEVPQKSLNRFLSLSSEFQLEGIGSFDQVQDKDMEPNQEIEPEVNQIQPYVRDATSRIDKTMQLKTESKKSEETMLSEAEGVVSEPNLFEISSELENRQLTASKFACGRCDYKTNRKDHLRTHSNSVHDEIRYPCNQCDYRATQQSHLARHRRNRHTNKI